MVMTIDMINMKENVKYLNSHLEQS